jgi:hypothetical protein
VSPPDPVRGGTFFYCPWQERRPGSAASCGGMRRGTRFRTASAYRRHWNRWHAARSAPPGVTSQGFSWHGELEKYRSAAEASGIVLPLTTEERRNAGLMDEINCRLKGITHPLRGRRG